MPYTPPGSNDGHRTISAEKGEYNNQAKRGVLNACFYGD